MSIFYFLHKNLFFNIFFYLTYKITKITKYKPLKNFFFKVIINIILINGIYNVNINNMILIFELQIIQKNNKIS